MLLLHVSSIAAVCMHACVCPANTDSQPASVLGDTAGLSTQLAAQAVLPLMESLSDTHMNQLVTSLHSRLTIK